MYKQEEEIKETSSWNLTLLQAEKQVHKNWISTYVLRLGGLAGEDRLLAKHFSGKQNIQNGNFPVNLLHIEDEVRILELFILNDYSPGTYNLCSPLHPSKKELYTKDCLRFNLPTPYFLNDNHSGKVVSVEKLLFTTGYNFLFHDPINYRYKI